MDSNLPVYELLARYQPLFPNSTGRCQATHVLQQSPQLVQHRLGVGEVLRHVHIRVSIYQQPVVSVLD